MSLYLPIIENLHGMLNDVVIDLYIDLYGVTCTIYEPEEENLYTDIYGNRDGDVINEDSKEVKVLLTGSLYEFFVSSDVDIGFLTETNVYVKSGETLKNGSKLVIIKNNGVSYNFRVQHINSIGIISDVSNRYTVTYIEE